MKTKSNKLVWTSILTAIASSLCCIAPLLAIVSGVTGAASSFAWLEPLRPYLIGFTVIVLGFAWYQQLKPKTEIHCNCDEDKPSFMQTKKFLSIITIFAILMTAFPYYSKSFYRNNKKQVTLSSISQVQKIDLGIEGMTCTGCEEHIIHAVQALDGILQVDASYKNEKATIEFDHSKVNINEIKKAIASTGYKIKEK